MKQARRDLNPQPPDLESGALAVRATGPYHDHAPSDSRQHLLFRICSDRDVYSNELSRFAMHRMLSTKATVLLALEPIRGSAFVLHGGVITLATAAAC
jgi:hypothetical protein